jgi:hypothetical protein
MRHAGIFRASTALIRRCNHPGIDAFRELSPPYRRTVCVGCRDSGRRRRGGEQARRDRANQARKVSWSSRGFPEAVIAASEETELSRQNGEDQVSLSLNLPTNTWLVLTECETRALPAQGRPAEIGISLLPKQRKASRRAWPNLAFSGKCAR